MFIDFFVHPEFAKHKKICRFPDSRAVYRNYLSHLIKILNDSNFPILIESPGGDNFFREKIPSENAFESDRYGEIRPLQEWERFSRLIEGRESDEMRIHGSYFGQCQRNFALQLFTYLKTRHNFYAQELEPNLRNLFQRESEYFGDIRNSRIRYGVTLFRTEKEDILRKLRLFQQGKSSETRMSFDVEERTKSFTNPFGNVNRQLINRGTVVYGLPE